MATVVSIGSSSTVVSGKITITVGAGGVPAGSTIVLFAGDNATGLTGSVADSGSNPWTYPTYDTGTGIEAIMMQAPCVTALVSGNTIVYTLSTGATIGTVSAFYITGLVPNSNTGSSSGVGTGTTPSGTSNTPVTGGNLWVAFVVSNTTSSSFTQDSTNAPWASPPGQVSLTAIVMGGGWFQSGDKLAHTYAPTLGTSGNWVVLISSFTVAATAGWEQLPTLLPNRRIPRGAFVWGDDIESPSPPRTSTPSSVGTGTSTTNNITSLALTTTAAVNAGDAVVVLVTQLAGATLRTVTGVSDTGGNIYTRMNANSSGLANIELWACPGFKATMNTGGTITATFSGAMGTAQRSTIQASKIAASVVGQVFQIDPGTGGAANGSATSVLSNRGTLASQREIIIGASWTQTNSTTEIPRGSFLNANVLALGTTDKVALDYQFVGTTASALYAPLWSTSGTILQTMGSLIFAPYGSFDITYDENQIRSLVHARRSGGALLGALDGTLPAPAPAVISYYQDYAVAPRTFRQRIEQRRAATRGATQFAIFTDPTRGWEAQTPQPPHPRSERSGAVAPIEVGTEAVYVFVPSVPPINWWDIQIEHPPHPRRERSAAWMRGDEGTQAQFSPPIPWWETHSFTAKGRPRQTVELNYPVLGPLINFLPFGWEVQSPQPPHPRPERAGGYNDPWFLQFTRFSPFSWEQLFQPPHPRPERSGSIAPIETGTEAIYVPPLGIRWGYEYSFQPPHPRPERFGSIAPIEPGIEAVYIPPSAPVIIQWGYELSFQPPRPRFELRSATRGATQFAIFTDPTRGWETQTPQPPHPRPERSGAVAPLELGIEAVYVFVPSVPAPKWGWEFQLSQPLHPRSERSGAVAPIETGTEAVYVFVPPPTLRWGWEVQYQEIRHPRLDRAEAARGVSQFAPSSMVLPGWELQTSALSVYPKTRRSGAIAPIETGTEAVYVFTQPPPIRWGYELSFQPPRPLFERRAATRGATQFGFFPAFVATGWEYQLPQPPHPRRERAAAIVQGDDGTEAPITPPVTVTLNWGYEEVRYYYRTTNRISAMLRGDDGIQSGLIRPFYSGWEVQPFQPPHRAPELKAAAWLWGDDGIQGPLIRQFYSGWEIQPFQPPHRAPEYKAAAWLWGDDGIQGTLIRTFYSGWEVQPVQPPHPRPERAAAVVAPSPMGNIEPTLIRTFYSGWEVQPPQPPHPRPERAAAVVAPSPMGNIEPTLIITFYSGWEVQPVQPPHPRPERGGAVMYGDDGIYNIYVYVKPPPPPPTIVGGGGSSYWFLKALEEQWEREERERQRTKRKQRALKKAQQKPPVQRALEKEIAPPAKAAPVQAKAPQTPPAKPRKPLVTLSDAATPTSPPLVKPVSMTLPPDLKFTSSIAKRQQREEDEEIIRLHMEAYEQQRKAVSDLLAKLIKDIENE